MRAPLRTALLCGTMMMLGASTAWAQGAGATAGGQAEMPDVNADLTAYRVDCDVFGWNKKFTEMASIGSEVKRTPRGAHRGEAFLLVFAIGSVQAKHNVHVLRITQAALPHDPIPLEDVRNRMWGIDYVYQKKWPRRPKRKHFKGAMKIEPIWESVELGGGLCQPTVGMLLTYKGQRRYQPHQQLRDIEAPCEQLRLTDTRIYWAKRDLGAAMMRWDYSPTENEISLRFPLSASWAKARKVSLMLRAPNPKEHNDVRKTLALYGGVKQEKGGDGSSWQVSFRGKELIYLAHRIAGLIGGRVADGTPPDGVDILVVAAPAAAATQPRAQTPLPGEVPDLDQPDCAGLLRDCD